MTPHLAAPTQTDWTQVPEMTRCLDTPHLAAAFADDAVVRRMDTEGTGIVVREPADRSCVVLGLYNSSTTEARISLNALLPEHANSAWRFISGSMRTSPAIDGMDVHLEAAGHVWLTATS
ncbi:hypothetical protein [Streptomyces sp. CMB-StM0423]|uniref:hypothetical protein n=1 Tax=Streptomyces sp. CMB-StM0423 TaxID=2059884 RepID=UPI000C6FD7DB|nr:hypothetical protein [Streptomyces sp. CMB-StM0423]AUH43405.1 hypothetical protein CXR04_27470 [Streptomyces sp. CMB-StM0423]